jgi:hypothetical protein
MNYLSKTHRYKTRKEILKIMKDSFDYLENWWVV